MPEATLWIQSFIASLVWLSMEDTVIHQEVPVIRLQVSVIVIMDVMATDVK